MNVENASSKREIDSSLTEMIESMAAKVSNGENFSAIFKTVELWSQSVWTPSASFR